MKMRGKTKAYLALSVLGLLFAALANPARDKQRHGRDERDQALGIRRHGEREQQPRKEHV